MNKLFEYVSTHCERGACQCGRCADSPGNPTTKQPAGHTADLIFFKVRATPEAKAEDLQALVKAHRGNYGPVDLFDGEAHSYLEVGGFIGDQGAALMLMGLGEILGIWKLLTPRTVFGGLIPEEMVMQMSGQGYVSIQAEKQ